MLEKQPMFILLHDRDSQGVIPRSKSLKTINFPNLKDNLENLESTKYLFILTSLTGLAEVADIVRTANQKHHLRVLFIREDIDSQWLPQIFDQANLRTMRNTIVHTDSEIPKRVFEAWRIGAQDHLIAKATVLGDRLLVVSCSMEEFEIPFQAMPALQCIPENERDDFIISEEGGYIYWQGADIHLDIDAFRSVIDPVEKQRFEALRLNHDKLFGQAIKALRQQHQLKQSEIAGLSERQVRRIESGERTKVNTLELLAKAHGMELAEYLDAVARLLPNISGQELRVVDSYSEETKSQDKPWELMGFKEQVQVIKKKSNSECPDMEECN
ncbi:helix-turn-helix domain-containing protein [Pannus brasiliensis CCIBt3594]|uniref:Helix-turn-helix domain-containing protein n=1 Tax=Pannus brasiliensis CCIBt3594 TaxID=1427578 RepID=A0AAW9QPU1_9CHRO